LAGNKVGVVKIYEMKTLSVLRQLLGRRGVRKRGNHRILAILERKTEYYGCISHGEVG